MRAVVLYLALGAAVAHAEDTAAATAAARAGYEEGMKHFNLRDFKEALDAFKRGYLAKPDPTFLFNIGQCQRMLGRWEDAQYSYRAYLRELPKTPNRADVERFIALAEQEMKRTATAVPPTGTMALPTAEPRPQPRVVPPATARPAPPPVAVPPAPVAVEPAQPPVVEVAPSSDASVTRAPQPIYRRWWLWTAIAAVVVVAAGVTIALVASSPHDASPPSGAPYMAVTF